MNIYHSTQVRPYVYFGIHKITGEIYIGYREANTLSSDLDLFIYKTSSKIVRPNFDEYDWYIVAEFLVGIDAYDFEQQLISEYWSNPLLLNRQYRLPNGKKRFRSNNKGRKLGPQSPERRAKTSELLTAYKAANPAWNKGQTKKTNESLAQLAANLSASLKGKEPHNKGKSMSHKGRPQQQVTCPHCGKEGGVCVMKRHHFDRCKFKS